MDAGRNDGHRSMRRSREHDSVRRWTSWLMESERSNRITILIRAILSNTSSCIESALPNSSACNANTMGRAPRSRSDLVYRFVHAFAGRHLSAHACVVRHQRHQAGARGLLWGMKTSSGRQVRAAAVGSVRRPSSGTHGNGRDAPIPAVRPRQIELVEPRP